MAKLQKQNSESLKNGYAIFKSRETIISYFKLAFGGKVTFFTNLICIVLLFSFMIDHYMGFA